MHNNKHVCYTATPRQSSRASCRCDALFKLGLTKGELRLPKLKVALPLLELCLHCDARPLARDCIGGLSVRCLLGLPLLDDGVSPRGAQCQRCSVRHSAPWGAAPPWACTASTIRTRCAALRCSRQFLGASVCRMSWGSTSVSHDRAARRRGDLNRPDWSRSHLRLHLSRLTCCGHWCPYPRLQRWSPDDISRYRTACQRC